MRAMMWTLLLVGAALAGCSDDGGSDEQGEDLLVVPETEAGLGVIVGIVLDEAITPVPGATVTLQEGGSTSTDENGAFGFGNLQPGTHFLRVEKPGYFTAQQSVEVEADVKSPPVLKVLLARDVASTPFYEEFTFKGFIECSVSTPAVRAAVCSFPDIVTGLLGMPPITNDEFLAVHDLADKPTHLQSEMVWDSTQALGDAMGMIAGERVADTGEFDDIKDVTGPSPLLLVLNTTEAGATALGEKQLQLRVFNHDAPGTTPPCLGGVCLWGTGATVEQEFEIITHAFYNYSPPEGWRFTEAGVPQPPQ